MKRGWRIGQIGRVFAVLALLTATFPPWAAWAPHQSTVSTANGAVTISSSDPNIFPAGAEGPAHYHGTLNGLPDPNPGGLGHGVVTPLQHPSIPSTPSNGSPSVISPSTPSQLLTNPSSLDLAALTDFSTLQLGGMYQFETRPGIFFVTVGGSEFPGGDAPRRWGDYENVNDILALDLDFGDNRTTPTPSTPADPSNPAVSPPPQGTQSLPPPAEMVETVQFGGQLVVRDGVVWIRFDPTVGGGNTGQIVIDGNGVSASDSGYGQTFPVMGTEGPNGVKIDHLPGGVIRLEFPDKTIVVRYPDGRVAKISPSGRRVESEPHPRTQERPGTGTPPPPADEGTGSILDDLQPMGPTYEQHHYLEQVHAAERADDRAREAQGRADQARANVIRAQGKVDEASRRLTQAAGARDQYAREHGSPVFDMSPEERAEYRRLEDAARDASRAVGDAISDQVRAEHDAQDAQRRADFERQQADRAWNDADKARQGRDAAQRSPRRHPWDPVPEEPEEVKITISGGITFEPVFRDQDIIIIGRGGEPGVEVVPIEPEGSSTVGPGPAAPDRSPSSGTPPPPGGIPGTAAPISPPPPPGPDGAEKREMTPSEKAEIDKIIRRVWQLWSQWLKEKDPKKKEELEEQLRSQVENIRQFGSKELNRALDESIEMGGPPTPFVPPSGAPEPGSSPSTGATPPPGGVAGAQTEINRVIEKVKKLEEEVKNEKDPKRKEELQQRLDNARENIRRFGTQELQDALREADRANAPLPSLQW